MTRVKASRARHGYVGRLLIHSLSIFGLSLVLAFITLLVHPGVVGFADGTLAEGEISLSTIPRDASVLWVDARSQAEYEAAHAPGAVLLNEDAFNNQVGNFIRRWRGDDYVVVYCSKEACNSSRAIARRLREEVGVKNVYHLRGGWETLMRSGYMELGAAQRLREDSR